MEELIPVYTADKVKHGVTLVDARLLHTKLEVGRDFSNWIKGRIDQYGFEEGTDFVTCSPNLASEMHGGQNKVDYHLTIDMAKELAIVENNDIGRKVRRYFIEMEEKARQLLTEQANHVLALPAAGSMRERLKLKDSLKLQDHVLGLIKKLEAESSESARYALYCGIRQVNELLGVPTKPLETFAKPVPDTAAHDEFWETVQDLLPHINHSGDSGLIAIHQPQFQRVVHEAGYKLSMEKTLRDIMYSHPHYLYRSEIKSVILKGKPLLCFHFKG